MESDDKLWLDLKEEITKLAAGEDPIVRLSNISALAPDHTTIEYHSLDAFYGLLDGYHELKANPKTIKYDNMRANEGGLDKLKEDAVHKAKLWLKQYLPESFR